MAFVTIETPYGAPNTESLERNMRYTVLAVKHAQTLDELAFAPNYLAQQVSEGSRGLVDESTPDPLGVGQEKAFELCNGARTKVDKVVFYTDLGMSGGMKIAEQFAQDNKIVTEYRTLPEDFLKHL